MKKEDSFCWYRSLPLNTPSGLIMGIILNSVNSRKAIAIG